MNFAGNDILFFANNATTFSRKGAASKILIENECSLLYPLKFIDNLMITWSIKECIYKILCKKGHPFGFSPKLITINTIEKINYYIYSGTAFFEKSNYFFQFELNQDYVYTYASECKKALNEFEHHFFKNPISNNSSITNAEFIKYIESNNWKLNYTKDNIPFVTETKNDIDISLTHDHNILALCVSKNR